MAVAAGPKLEEVRELTAARGVEFFFAQFVDLYGRPSAKLVPAANLDSLACPKGPNNPAQHRFEHDLRFPSRDLGNSCDLLDKFDLPHMMIGRKFCQRQ